MMGNASTHIRIIFKKIYDLKFGEKTFPKTLIASKKISIHGFPVYYVHGYAAIYWNRTVQDLKYHSIFIVTRVTLIY